MKRFVELCLIGLIAGSIFGGLLKLVEMLTDKRVYMLLLNVDYFPILKDIYLPEVVEFSLHLFVSIIVVIVLYYGLQLLNNEYKVSYYVWLNIAIGALLFLTTNFSQRTPSLFDVQSFAYWLLGHIVFGILIGFMIKQFLKE